MLKFVYSFFLINHNYDQIWQIFQITTSINFIDLKDKYARYTRTK